MEQSDRIQLAEIYGKMSIQDLVKEMADVKGKLDVVSAEKTNLQEKFDMIRLGVLPEKMDEEDTSTITVAGVGRASIQSDIYFSIAAENREEAYKWLRENGHGDIIQETVNSSTGKAFAKELIKKGEDLPGSLFKVTPFSRVQLTRVK